MRRRATSAQILALLLLASAVMPPAASAATTFVVTSADDSGGACTPTSCTLRAAINAANGTSGASVVTFNIPPGGRQTIAVGSQLPTLTAANLTIDGTTQPGATAPGIRLDDPRTGNADVGLLVMGTGVAIRGLSITRFGGLGIHLLGATNATIAGNWVGTADGTTALGNGNVGVMVEGGSGNTIGGATAAARNVIAGTVLGWAGDGIQVHDSSMNVVSGNYVGMTADGLGRLPNADTGIEVSGNSVGNRIGGLTSGERNVTSGNNGIGLQLLGVMNGDGTCRAPASTLVQGNYVGVNANGVRPGSYGNSGEGIALQVCSHDNVIGGTTASARNIVSGNRDDGIKIEGLGGPAGGSCNNKVQGNYIGLDATGSFSVPNNVTGVKVQNGACATVIGGSAAGAGNVISGNLSDAIYVRRPSTVDTTIEANVIGLAPDASRLIGNGDNGIHVWSGAQRTVIRNNVVSGNATNGLLIENPGTNGTLVVNNRIGVNNAASATRPNKRNGVWINDGAQSSAVQDNVVMGNTAAGVVVERPSGGSTATIRNRITRNRIEANGALGIDLVPAAGINPNDGNSNDGSVGNNGIDFPVITAVTPTSALGTAPPAATVELFQLEAGGAGPNGEGAVYLGSATADATGAWCMSGVSITGAATATATDGNGNTSEFAVNRSVAAGTACGGPAPTPSPTPSPSVAPTPSPTVAPTPSPTSGTTIFSDTFTAPDGSAPGQWAVSRTAAGQGAGAVIQSEQLRETVALTAAQDGIWQYVEARATPVQVSWANGQVSLRWQMSTLATSSQSGGVVLTPTVTTSNAVNQADYLRIRVSNGNVAIIRRVGAAGPATLWSGSQTASSDVRGFELRIDAQSVSLYEGPVGAELLRVGPIAHGLTWQTGALYLHAQSSSAAATYVVAFDNVLLSGAPAGAASAPPPPTIAPTPALTPAPSAAPTDTVIVAAGDISCAPTDPAFNLGLGTLTACRERSTSDLVLSQDPDAVFALGDQQYEIGALTDFLSVYDVTWGRFKPITRPALGNHEYGVPDATGYFGYFGSLAGPAGTGYYSYDLGGWHVVVLNSNCSAVGGCQAGSTQEQWLRADLAAHPATCTVAYWHHPRFSSGSHGNTLQVAPLWAALDDAGAELVLSGHDHIYERFAPQDANGNAAPLGVRELIVGTGGANLVAIDTVQPNSEVRSATTIGVLRLTLHPSSYEWQFLSDPAGGFADSGQDTCH